MKDPKAALLFLQELRQDLVSLDFLDSGVIFLLDNNSTEWYVFIKAERLRPVDSTNIALLLVERGERSDYSLEEVSNHPKKAFMASGTFEEIMENLDAIGKTQREFQTERIRVQAQQN